MFHFLLRRPDVGEVDRLAVLAGAKGVFVQVEVDAASDSEGDDERRGHQVVGADFGVHTAFEVAIAGENGGDHKVLFFNGVRDFRQQRAGVADAGSAAVADEVELELFQIRHESGAGEVVCDDFRAGGERALDPGLGGEAFLDGFLSQQACCHENGRV